MAYIGNQVSSVLFSVDTFSGDGFATSFGPMNRSPAGAPSVAVFVGGSYKTPTLDYTISGNYINFTTPPAVGTNNITVHHLGNGVIATQTPVDGSVTGTKITSNSIRGNNIVAGQITGNLIAVGAVTTNHISVGAITGNLLATNIINSNNIVDGSILGNDLGVASVSGNNIGVQAVSGNNIGIGAISANNFAGGGITSNVLSSNLSISLTRALESANINVLAPNGNVNIDIANNVVYYFTANTTANVTFNLRANTQNTFDSVTTIGQSVTLAMIVRHGTIRHIANVYIDGGLINTGSNTIVYLGNTKPSYQSITAQETNIYGYTVLKTAANTYAVFASNSLFALG
jgi:hypothetical protein